MTTVAASNPMAPMEFVSLDKPPGPPMDSVRSIADLLLIHTDVTAILEELSEPLNDQLTPIVTPSRHSR